MKLKRVSVLSIETRSWINLQSQFNIKMTGQWSFSKTQYRFEYKKNPG